MSLPSQVTNVLSQIDKKTAGHPLLSQFESNTGLPRSYGVLGVGGLYFVLVFLNVGGIGQLLSNIAGLVIPGYFSLVALQTRTTSDDTQLLTYWVIFAFLNVIEFWSKAILYWIPFYYFFKTIFLLYIGFPQTGGAETVYNSILKPISDKYVGSGSRLSETIDDAAEGVSSGVQL
ncbi:Piso0_005362 [Millerozyma farinosa CBS 7064]|uniref:Protein YOP1 n=1 Tax=Pichia sorbitophila (strain ATCC MYA-4447 / BCRC 22081 / CBS 7064 / NBRC 10061 / NRRL Y-12695) TaxID=559304 RepID=G8Y4W9_PICSO|nr:Piso0_005362 [Millerozyma farinosa CBS 7064]